MTAELPGLDFQYVQQGDGSYVLTFAQGSVRVQVAITAGDLRVMLLELFATLGGLA